MAQLLALAREEERKRKKKEKKEKEKNEKKSRERASFLSEKKKRLTNWFRCDLGAPLAIRVPKKMRGGRKKHATLI